MKTKKLKGGPPNKQRSIMDRAHHDKDVALFEAHLKPMVPKVLDSNRLPNVLEDIKYPILATPKVDGVRCLTLTGGMAVDENKNEIENKHVQVALKEYGMGGMDGVLSVTDCMTKKEVEEQLQVGTARTGYVYFVFDLWNRMLEPYSFRVKSMEPLITTPRPPMIKVMPPTTVYDGEGLIKCLTNYSYRGFAGITLRAPEGTYVHEDGPGEHGYLLELSVYTVEEARIADIDELRGFRCRTKSGVFFWLRHGFSLKEKDFFNRNKTQYIGGTVTFKYQPLHDKPKYPIFLKAKP